MWLFYFNGPSNENQSRTRKHRRAIRSRLLNRSLSLHQLAFEVQGFCAPTVDAVAGQPLIRSWRPRTKKAPCDTYTGLGVSGWEPEETSSHPSASEESPWRFDGEVNQSLGSFKLITRIHLEMKGFIFVKLELPTAAQVQKRSQDTAVLDKLIS